MSSSFLSLFLTVSPVFAHVVIKPNEAGIASFQTFDVDVPSEKDIPTVSIRLVIPEGLKEIMPNVKPGWNIALKKDGDVVTEIDWTGGNIPAEQRDDFYFNAQVPSAETTLIWKTYQTYQDGSIVAWDANPSTVKKGEEGTPYSQTKIINDLKDTGVQKDTESQPSNTQIPFVFSIIAVALSVIAFMRTQQKNQ